LDEGSEGDEERRSSMFSPPLLLLSLFFALCSSCGYRAVYGGTNERFHVKVVRMLVPDAVACDEVASGVRDELAKGGAVEAGDGYPRVEIEVLRGGEGSVGIADVGGSPVARGMEVGLSARAWIVRSKGAAPERDTGDLRAAEVITVDEVAAAPDTRGESFHFPEARRAAARRLGRKLAEKLMGLPAASEDDGTGEP
jgi:hypothetical protein